MRRAAIICMVVVVTYESRRAYAEHGKALEAAVAFVDFLGGIPVTEVRSGGRLGHRNDRARGELQPESKRQEHLQMCPSEWKRSPFVIQPKRDIYGTNVRTHDRHNYMPSYYNIWADMRESWKGHSDSSMLEYIKFVFQRTTSRRVLYGLGKSAILKAQSDMEIDDALPSDSDSDTDSDSGSEEDIDPIHAVSPHHFIPLLAIPREQLKWKRDIHRLCTEIGSCKVCYKLFKTLNFLAYLYTDERDSSLSVPLFMPWLESWIENGENQCKKETLGLRVRFDDAIIEHINHVDKALKVKLTLFDFEACPSVGYCELKSGCPKGVQSSKEDCTRGSLAHHCIARKKSSCLGRLNCRPKYICVKREADEYSDMDIPVRHCTYVEGDPKRDQGCEDGEVCNEHDGRVSHEYVRGVSNLFHLHTVHRKSSELPEFPHECKDKDRDTTSACYDDAGFEHTSGSPSCLAHKPGSEQKFTVYIDSNTGTNLQMIFYLHDGRSSGTSNHFIYDHRKFKFQPEALLSLRKEGQSWLPRDEQLPQCPFIDVLANKNFVVWKYKEDE